MAGKESPASQLCAPWSQSTLTIAPPPESCRCDIKEERVETRHAAIQSLTREYFPEHPFQPVFNSSALVVDSSEQPSLLSPMVLTDTFPSAPLWPNNDNISHNNNNNNDNDNDNSNNTDNDNNDSMCKCKCMYY